MPLFCVSATSVVSFLFDKSSFYNSALFSHFFSFFLSLPYSFRCVSIYLCHLCKCVYGAICLTFGAYWRSISIDSASFSMLTFGKSNRALKRACCVNECVHQKHPISKGKKNFRSTKEYFLLLITRDTYKPMSYHKHFSNSMDE